MAIELVTGHGGSAHVTGADIGEFNAGVAGTDVYYLGEKPNVIMADANTVSISPCALLINGRYFKVTGTTTVAIQSGSQTGKRCDLVYMEYTLDSTGIEPGTIKVATGVTATSPVDPALPYPASILDQPQTADVAIARVSLNGLTPAVEWLVPKLPNIAALEARANSIEAKANANKTALDNMYYVNQLKKLSFTNRGFTTNNSSSAYRVGNIVYVQLTGETNADIIEWQKFWLVTGLPAPAIDLAAPMLVQNTDRAPVTGLAVFDTSGTTKWLSFRNLGWNGTIKRGAWIFANFSYITNDPI